MTAPSDGAGVLAVMRSDAVEAKCSRRRAGSPYVDALAAESDAARAAVAELIAAAQEVSDEVAGTDLTHDDAYHLLKKGPWPRLRAALAQVAK